MRICTHGHFHCESLCDLVFVLKSFHEKVLWWVEALLVSNSEELETGCNRARACIVLFQGDLATHAHSSCTDIMRCPLLCQD